MRKVGSFRNRQVASSTLALGSSIFQMFNQLDLSGLAEAGFEGEIVAKFPGEVEVQLTHCVSTGHSYALCPQESTSHQRVSW